jgi:murein L,D-transpeptidase YcbB/YkuD
MTHLRRAAYRAHMNTFASPSRWICCLLLAFLHAVALGQTVPRSSLDARLLTPRLYAGTPPPAWLDDGGARARTAVRLLRDAPLHGLDPARYDTEGLAHRLDDVTDAVDALALERDLSTAMLQYLSDLRFGRVASGYRPSADVAEFDPVERLRAALLDGRLAQAVDAAAPPIAMVKRVEATLAQYRALAAAYPAWQPLPPPAPRTSAGARYAGAALLRERLRLLGDLDPAAPAGSGDQYTAELATAVRRFQARHGLDDDGVLGPATMAALAVPPARRVAQLELTLERLRWLPRPPRGRVVVVDVPAYRLWAFDVDEPAGPLLEMRVIVGAAARTPTPLFIGQMRRVEFNPYWNVPRSIEQHEIIPKLARDPGYLAQNDMELVGPSGQVLADAGGSAIAALRAGTARVRQRPGARNALGAVKFSMPNPMNIYLHSTSTQSLFDRSRRDLSHGCIRVEHPAALAQFVLADPARWDADAVAAAMRPGRTLVVPLRETVPVVLFYATALTDREGRALFAEDIYGLDEQLTQALRAD